MGSLTKSVYGTIAGGYFNSIPTNSSYTTVGGGGLNTAGGDYSTVPGGAQNFAMGNYSLAAGRQAQANHAGAFVWEDSQAAGFLSSAPDQFSVRAAGGVRLETSGAGLALDGRPVLTSQVTPNDGSHSNIVNVVNGSPANSVASGVFGATIAGGGGANYQGVFVPNAVLADFGSVGGGQNNTSSGAEATVAGGSANTASGDTATVGGGSGNTASGPNSMVGGGYGNLIQTSTSSASIGGGAYNTIQTSASYATIGGGSYNTIQSNASYATIGGGAFNTISTNAFSATIPGGFQNVASGNYSTAMGQSAHAIHANSFVWADAQPSYFISTGINQFLIRAAGGVGINTANPGTAALAVNGRETISGANVLEFGYGVAGKEANAGRIGYQTFTADALDVIGAGTGARKIKFWCEAGAVFTGTITQPSDRNIKQDFHPLNAQDVLAKVAALPVASWAYKFDAAKRHIGPVAQDFHAAFGLNGEDETSIATVDESGVALAAIQGLNQKLEAEGKAKDDRIAELEKRLAVIESLLQK